MALPVQSFKAVGANKPNHILIRKPGNATRPKFFVLWPTARTWRQPAFWQLKVCNVLDRCIRGGLSVRVTPPREARITVCDPSANFAYYILAGKGQKVSFGY